MNYIVEDNIDFYAELKKSLESNNIKNEDNITNIEDDKCLISNKSFEEYSIELECGHKFNYIPLIKTLIETKNNPKFRRTYRFKCPYCRNIQFHILPYVPHIYKQRILGINSPSNCSMMNNKCNYVFKSGKNKNKQCNVDCYFEICHKHIKMNNNTTLITDNDLSKIKLDNKLSKYTVPILKKLAKLHKKKNYSKLIKSKLIDLLLKK